MITAGQVIQTARRDARYPSLGVAAVGAEEGIRIAVPILLRTIIADLGPCTRQPRCALYRGHGGSCNAAGWSGDE